MNKNIFIRIFSFTLCLLMCLTQLTIVEVTAADENIALGKPAYSSGSYSTAYSAKLVTQEGVVCWAQGGTVIDGEYFSIPGEYYVAVDLEQRYNIDRIVIQNRLDGAASSSGWRLQVANQKNFSDAVTLGYKTEAGGVGAEWTTYLDAEEAYRYVRVTWNNHFAVGMIKVYGTVFDPNVKVVSAMKDIAGTELEGPITLVENLGIMARRSKELFALNELVTRMEALKYTLACVGSSESNLTTEMFLDVPISHPDNGYLAAGVQMGIISKASEFRPDDYVTVNEFAKMLACAIGYSTYVDVKGGWTMGINNAARKIDLLSLVDAKGDEHVSRGDAAALLYNTLMAYPMSINAIKGENVNIAQDDETVLENVYGLTLHEGIVTGDKVTTLTDSKQTEYSDFQIDGVDYKADSIVNEYLGKRIRYTIDENNVIKCVWPYENNIVVIDADDVENSTKDTVSAYKNDRLVTYKLEDAVDVVKNGGAFLDWTEETLEPAYGRLELIDNDDDKMYDVVLAWEPVPVVVKKVNYDNDFSILAQNLSQAITVKEPIDITIKKNGKGIAYSRIREGELALVYVPESGKSVKIDVISNTITAKAESLTDSTITLSEKKYDIARTFRGDSALNNTLMSGEKTYVLDDKDRIVWIMESKSTEGVLGIIQAIGFENKDFSSDFRIKVFSENGKFDIFELNKKVKIDGKMMDTNSISSEYPDLKGSFQGKFALYKTNKDGLIIELDTENHNPTLEPDSKMIRADYKVKQGEDVFIWNAEGFYAHNLYRFSCTRSTRGFIIPANNGVVAIEDRYNSLFSATTADILFPDLTQTPASEDTAFFGVGEDGYPTFAVKYVPYAEITGSSSATTITSSGAPGMIVDEVLQVLRDDGEICYQIDGYALGGGGKKSIVLDDNVGDIYNAYIIYQEHPEWLTGSNLLSPALIEANITEAEAVRMKSHIQNLQKGDIIRYQEQNGRALAVECVFSRADGNREFVINMGKFYQTGGAYPMYASAVFRLVYGTMETYKNGRVTMQTFPGVADGEPGTMRFSAGSAKLVISDGETLEIVSGDLLPLYWNANSKLMVYTTQGATQLMILYKY